MALGIGGIEQLMARYKEEHDRQLRIDLNCLQIAFIRSKMSKDTATQVGAVLVHKDGKQVSWGYNGTPTGVEEPEGLYEQRPEKYEWIIHAEENSLINAKFDTEGSTIYCTLHPCHKCMERILQHGVKRVVYYAHNEQYPGGIHSATRRDIIEACRRAGDIQIVGIEKHPDIEMLRT